MHGSFVVSWSGNGQRFSYEMWDQGWECARPGAPPPDPSSSKPHCHGSAPSCSSTSASSCSGVKGCYTSAKYEYDGSLTEVCRGVATSCGSFHSASDCDQQVNCYWE